LINVLNPKVIRRLFTLRITPIPRGNREGRAKKPATESHRAQGRHKCVKVLKVVVKPPSGLSQPPVLAPYRAINLTILPF